MKGLRIGLMLVGVLVAVSGCACRGGHYGPYGGYHPGGCVLF